MTTADEICFCSDEATVQGAMAKAAAAGVPSSDPMNLQELEAVQAKMAAKKRQYPQQSGNLQQPPVRDASFRDLPGVTNVSRNAEAAHRDSLSDVSRDGAAAQDVATSSGTERGHG